MSLVEAISILGLEGGKAYNEDGLKRAYRSTIKSTHPDIAGGTNEDAKLVIEAFEVLKEELRVKKVIKVRGLSAESASLLDVLTLDKSVLKNVGSIQVDTYCMCIEKMLVRIDYTVLNKEDERVTTGYVYGVAKIEQKIDMVIQATLNIEGDKSINKVVIDGIDLTIKTGVSIVSYTGKSGVTLRIDIIWW